MAASRQGPARFALWLLLGGWIGALVFFQVVMTPAAFSTLPSTELAGRLVSRTLAILNLAGAGIGVGLAALALRLRRGLGLALLPLALAALCLVSHFGVSPALAEVRDAAFEAGDVAARLHFDRLHRASVVLFAVTQLGAIVLLALHVRAERS